MIIALVPTVKIDKLIHQQKKSASRNYASVQKQNVWKSTANVGMPECIAIHPANVPIAKIKCQYN